MYLYLYKRRNLKTNVNKSKVMRINGKCKRNRVDISLESRNGKGLKHVCIYR